jgi:hypothetical protein
MRLHGVKQKSGAGGLCAASWCGAERGIQRMLFHEQEQLYV